jgi:hypothetical protein
MHAEEFTDTDPRAMEVWLELLRQKTPGTRLKSSGPSFSWGNNSPPC